MYESKRQIMSFQSRKYNTSTREKVAKRHRSYIFAIKRSPELIATIILRELNFMTSESIETFRKRFRRTCFKASKQNVSSFYSKILLVHSSWLAFCNESLSLWRCVLNPGKMSYFMTATSYFNLYRKIVVTVQLAETDIGREIARYEVRRETRVLEFSQC